MKLCGLLLISVRLCLAAPSAEEIMRQVAANQERARSARERYVYDMGVFVRLKRANGKTAREEQRSYTVTPAATGADGALRTVDGKIFEGGSVRAYHEAAYRTKDSDIDGAITNQFAHDLLWRKGAFGPAMNWFPVDKDGISGYTFQLRGEEKYKDFDVYRMAFRGNEHADNCWRGEILVERNELQPVLVTTEWACRIPLAVQAMLGTSVKQLGTKISYERFDKDLWFPVKCGGEMKFRVLFLYARTIAFSAINSDFRKTDAVSSVKFDQP